MSSATTTTGRFGIFGVVSDTPLPSEPVAGGNDIARCTQWTVSQKPASVSEWGDSSSGGYTCRAPGRRDATFTAEGKFDTTSQQWDVFQGGDYASAKLFVNSNTPTWSYYFARAVCSEFNLTVNIDTEEVVGWTSSWGSDGTIAYPGESAIQDVPYSV